MSLTNLQQKFSKEIVDGKASEMLELINEHKSISKEGLFSVYTDNYFLGLREVLQNIYPVTKQLVGENFFNGTAKEFAKSNPPRSGNLDDYSSNLSEFLKEFEPAKQLPYLPDIAEFEWKYHCCELADEAENLSPQKLAGLSPEELLSLKFVFSPSVQFFESKFPIMKIWQQAQEEEFGEIDLDIETGDSLLIIRNNRKVVFVPAEENEIIFLKKLFSGNQLADAFEYISEDENFDLNYFVNKHLSSGTWSDIKN